MFLREGKSIALGLARLSPNVSVNAMKIIRIRPIEGPNVFSHQPVLVMRLDLEDLTGKESYEIPGFVDRLLQALPGVREHHCAKGRPGGFVERLHEGTY